MNMQGFRFIEVVSQCPTAFGRRAGFKDVSEMLKGFKENSVTTEQAEKLSKDALTQKIVVGEFIQRQRKTLIENVHDTIREAQEVEED